jgi:hypothetical protein
MDASKKPRPAVVDHADYFVHYDDAESIAESDFPSPRDLDEDDFSPAYASASASTSAATLRAHGFYLKILLLIITPLMLLFTAVIVIWKPRSLFGLSSAADRSTRRHVD